MERKIIYIYPEVIDTSVSLQDIPILTVDYPINLDNKLLQFDIDFTANLGTATMFTISLLVEYKDNENNDISREYLVYRRTSAPITNYLLAQQTSNYFKFVDNKEDGYNWMNMYTTTNTLQGSSSVPPTSSFMGFYNSTSGEKTWLNRHKPISFSLRTIYDSGVFTRLIIPRIMVWLHD